MAGNEACQVATENSNANETYFFGFLINTVFYLSICQKKISHVQHMLGATSLLSFVEKPTPESNSRCSHDCLSSSSTSTSGAGRTRSDMMPLSCTPRLSVKLYTKNKWKALWAMMPNHALQGSVSKLYSLKK